MWSSESIALQWRHPIEELVTFDMSAGIDGVGIAAPRSTSAFLTEVAVSGSALFREPSGVQIRVGLGGRVLGIEQPVK